MIRAYQRFVDGRPPDVLSLPLFADSLPAVFLYHARGVQGVNRRVRGVRMDLRGELVTITQWEVGSGQ